VRRLADCDLRRLDYDDDGVGDVCDSFCCCWTAERVRRHPGGLHLPGGRGHLLLMELSRRESVHVVEAAGDQNVPARKERRGCKAARCCERS
jgi:hypothetical protein